MFAKYVGSRLSLLLIDKDDDDEPAVMIYPGTVAQSDDGYFLDRGEKPALKLQPEWMDRIKPVPEGIRETMQDADWYLRLNVCL